ncbi:hypothetical protein V2I01_41135 [Micromonospora sp. BRA006-A]|nr:hypothetical protein [Micromonospora sp. BRA006-A]
MITIDIEARDTIVELRVRRRHRRRARRQRPAGLARRVAALDGRFDVQSPPGGPTAIRAELPCA